MSRNSNPQQFINGRGVKRVPFVTGGTVTMQAPNLQPDNGDEAVIILNPGVPDIGTPEFDEYLKRWQERYG